MNRILLFLTLLLLSFPTWGQISINVEPGTFSLTGNPANTDVSFHLDVVNNSAVEVSLLWSRTIESAPSEWSSWICDKNLCYLPAADDCSPSKPNVLAPGEHMDFQIHVNPYLTEGTTGYDIAFQDSGNPGSVLAHVQGEVMISNTVSTQDNTSSPGLTVFPNPASEYFQVTETPGLHSIELFNIVGSKVRSYGAASQKQYYIGDLNEGIYLVRLVSSTKKVLKTIRLSKR